MRSPRHRARSGTRASTSKCNSEPSRIPGRERDFSCDTGAGRIQAVADQVPHIWTRSSSRIVRAFHVQRFLMRRGRFSRFRPGRQSTYKAGFDPEPDAVRSLGLDPQPFDPMRAPLAQLDDRPSRGAQAPVLRAGAGCVQPDLAHPRSGGLTTLSEVSDVRRRNVGRSVPCSQFADTSGPRSAVPPVSSLPPIKAEIDQDTDAIRRWRMKPTPRTPPHSHSLHGLAQIVAIVAWTNGDRPGAHCD